LNVEVYRIGFVVNQLREEVKGEWSIVNRVPG
jgi:hypothetical protein